MINLNFKTILKALKNFNESPSKEWQTQTLHKIRSLQQPAEIKQPFILFNLFVMKKLLSGVLAVMVVAVGFGYFYSTNTPYAKAQAHLQNIQEALSQLQSYGETNTVSMVQPASLFPVAYADASTDALIAQLVQKIHDEGDAALTEAEKIENAETIAKLLAEIAKVQNEIVKVYSDVLEKVKDEALANALSAAIEDTANTTKVVDAALDSVRQALKEQRKEFKAEMMTKVKELKATKEADRLKSAEDLLKALGTDPKNLTESMQKKYETLKAILEACETEDEKCNSGKAHGLAVALTAQVRNEARQQEHDDDRYGYQGESDDQDDDDYSTKFEDKNQKEQELEAKKEAAEALREENKQKMERDREAAKDLEEQNREQAKDEREDEKEAEKALKERQEDSQEDSTSDDESND